MKKTKRAFARSIRITSLGVDSDPNFSIEGQTGWVGIVVDTPWTPNIGTPGPIGKNNEACILGLYWHPDQKRLVRVRSLFPPSLETLVETMETTARGCLLKHPPYDGMSIKIGLGAYRATDAHS